MADIEWELQSPTVKVVAMYDGTFRVVVDCYRDKRGGKSDELHLRFSGLVPGEIECIVGSISEALQKQEARLDDVRSAMQ